MTVNLNTQPDIKISTKQVFGIDSNMEIEAFSKKNEYVPEIDKNYKFDRDTTLAILSGFQFNKRGKYGRVLGEVFVKDRDNGKEININELMVTEGHAIKYTVQGK